MATIQEVYIALFGRPADPVGLRFYNQATDNGNNLDAVGELSGSDEYLDRFEGQSDVQAINQIYQDLFGRDADAQGLLFYTQLLQSGQASIQDIAIRIIDGATGADQAIVDAKVAAANLFTASLNEGREIVAYSGQEGIDFGQSYLSQVTSADTVPTQAEVDAQISDFLAGDDTPKNQFNFTDAVGEQLVGTDQNDAFNGVVGTAGTVNVGDTVNGGAGVDTLNLLVSSLLPTSIPAGFTSNGVEIVNITYAGGNSLGALNSSTFGGVQQLWQVDSTGASTFQNVTVGNGVTAGFRSTSAVQANSTVTAAAGVTSVAIALDGVGTGSALNIAGAGVKTVDVSGSVFNAAGPEALSLTSNATNLDAVNISLSGATVVTLNGADTAETINLAGSTGGITLDLSGAAGNALSLTSLVGGSGADVLEVAVTGLSAAAVTINGGAGNDTITVDLDNLAGATDTATALTITGGTGNDTFDFDGAAGNLVAVTNTADLQASLVTVTDFTAANDVLNISGIVAGGDITLQNTVNGAVAGAADLFAAVTAAAGVTDNGDFALFEFGGNTYIYGETGAANGLDAGDTLIQLTGVDLSDLNTGTNFVA